MACWKCNSHRVQLRPMGSSTPQERILDGNPEDEIIEGVKDPVLSGAVRSAYKDMLTMHSAYSLTSRAMSSNDRSIVRYEPGRLSRRSFEFQGGVENGMGATACCPLREDSHKIIKVATY